MLCGGEIQSIYFMKKLPWGIIAGICAIVVFFTTVGTVAAFIILNAVAAQTSETATLFDEWWQTVLFVFSILSAVGFIGSLTMCFLKTNGKQTEGEADENEAI